jgi:hypothetical protein
MDSPLYLPKVRTQLRSDIGSAFCCVDRLMFFLLLTLYVSVQVVRASPARLSFRTRPICDRLGTTYRRRSKALSLRGIAVSCHEKYLVSGRCVHIFRTIEFVRVRTTRPFLYATWSLASLGRSYFLANRIAFSISLGESDNAFANAILFCSMVSLFQTKG